MAAEKDFTLCRTGRGLAASQRPFGDARFPVRHSAAEAEVLPCHQATQLNNEVSTLTPLSRFFGGNSSGSGSTPCKQRHNL